MGNTWKIMLGSHLQSATKFCKPLRKQMPESPTGNSGYKDPWIKTGKHRSRLGSHPALFYPKEMFEKLVAVHFVYYEVRVQA